jgi:hypothetical protein
LVWAETRSTIYDRFDQPRTLAAGHYRCTSREKSQEFPATIYPQVAVLGGLKRQLVLMGYRTAPSGIARFVVVWAVLFAAYMLFSEVASPEELVAGAACAGVGSAAMREVHGNSTRRFAVQIGWLVWLVAKQTPAAFCECWGLFLALFRPAAERNAGIGRMISIPFDGTRGHTPAEAAGRRVLVTIAICFTPNSVVIGPEFQPGYLLIHQLVPREAPHGHGDPVWPV